MTPDRRLQIARQIVIDGITTELARAERGPLQDMSQEDRQQIKILVGRIGDLTQYATIQQGDFWVVPSLSVSR